MLRISTRTFRKTIWGDRLRREGQELRILQGILENVGGYRDKAVEVGMSKMRIFTRIIGKCRVYPMVKTVEA